ncbi:HET-domain-containing protein [Hypomontagnella monticulosa]|nr:HET-domain-containing protein [Hypomontagnella monticulosa]
MRLLNAKTLKLHEFFNDIPRYAILSHTWEDGEVTFQDLKAGRGPSKRGWKKIASTCRQARRDGFEWAWVDTCCIDKKNSAELSEAINSMYRWYRNSAICYVFLSDMKNPVTNENWRKPPRWLKRAWTLQELIAPQKLIFYDRGWKQIGDRADSHIAEVISELTRIPIAMLQKIRSPSSFSVAARMSWAAHRKSTRIEDRAYSLLGLFNINMPLIYGEGEQAFRRLQEEIHEKINDLSLLFWYVSGRSPRAWTLGDVLAQSPDDFIDCGRISRVYHNSDSPSLMTNMGLQVCLSLTKRFYNIQSHLYYGNASCSTHYAWLKDVKGFLLSIILVESPQSLCSTPISRYTRLITPFRYWAGMIGETMNEQIYIRRGLQFGEYERFGSGGVHLQNIPTPRSPPASAVEGGVGNERIAGLEIQDFHCSDDDDRSPDGDPDIHPPSKAMWWSKEYDCVVFGSALLRSPELPYHVVFGVTTGWSSFSMLLAWNKDWIHFSLQNIQLLSDLLRQSPEERSQTLINISRDQSGGVSYLGNCWEMYGRITSIRIARTDGLGSDEIEFILEREDPRTGDGEAAGNRLHFLIQARLVS